MLIPKNIIRLINILSALISVISPLFLAYVVISHYPDNHIGFDLRPFLFLIFICSFICTLTVASKWRFIMWGWTLAILFGSVAIDRCNLLVQYDVWLRRGQPAFAECRL